MQGYYYCCLLFSRLHITSDLSWLPTQTFGTTPCCSLSSLTSHFIPDRPISSLLMCSPNRSHHTYTRTHTCTEPRHIHARPRSPPHPPGLFEALSVNDSPPLYGSVKPKVQLYKGCGTSMCASARVCLYPPPLLPLAVVFY